MILAEATAATIPVNYILTAIGTALVAIGGFLAKWLRGVWRDLWPRCLSILDEHLGLLRDTRESVAKLTVAVSEMREDHRATRATMDELVQEIRAQRRERISTNTSNNN